MNSLLLCDNNSESVLNSNVNTQTPLSSQLSPNKSVEFQIPEVSIEVVNTAYERHTSGLMSTYLYHILTKVRCIVNLYLYTYFKFYDCNFAFVSFILRPK